MKIPNGIIDISNFGIPENYLKLTKIVREEICRKIISSTLATIKSNVSLDEKYAYMYGIFLRNEKYYTNEEIFEASQIFLDLQNALNEEFNNLNKNVS
jgi:hypothetical protein